MTKARILWLVCLFILIELPQFAEEWKRVYLTSYPRSGSHWARYLIEEAANIATSSVYQDRDTPRHLPTPFAWGGYSPKHGYEGCRPYPQVDDIVVIKTHFPAVPRQPFDLQLCLRAIRIVRHPVDSIYSYYTYMNRARKSTLTKALRNYMKSWRRYQEYWNEQQSVLTVRYEDLVANPKATLTEIMRAIGYDFRQEDIDRAISRYPPNDAKHVHRSEFSKTDLKRVKRELKDLMKQFNYTITSGI